MKVTVEDMGRVETILLNGADVIGNCREASEREGYAICLMRNERGDILADENHKPLWGRFEGEVEITLEFEEPEVN